MYKTCGDCAYFNLTDPEHMKGCCRIYGINPFAETPICGFSACESTITQKQSSFDSDEKKLLDAIDEFLETCTVGDLLKVVAYAVASQEGIE